MQMTEKDYVNDCAAIFQVDNGVWERGLNLVRRWAWVLGAYNTGDIRHRKDEKTILTINTKNDN